MSNIKHNALSATLVMLFAGLNSQPLFAESASSSMGISAAVSDNCEISSLPMSFGAYDPVTTHATSPMEGTGAVVIHCTNGTEAYVMLNHGENPDSGSTDEAPMRRLVAYGEFLPYTLYQDSVRSVVWGNNETSSYSYEGVGVAEVLTVYARVPAGLNVTPGEYSDNVVATVEF